jgi:hypothetical protein
MLSLDPWAQAVFDSATLYNLSANAADRGAPMLPLYAEYRAGGDLTVFNDVVRVTLEANSPVAARGYTSLEVNYDGSASDGYFQFGTGTDVADRPRDKYGLASHLRLWVRSEEGSPEQLRVRLYRSTGPGGAFDSTPLMDVPIPLTTTWTDQAVILPAGIRPVDLHSIQFYFHESTDGATPGVRAWLDEVRLTTEKAEPHRAVQSYFPGSWVPSFPCDGSGGPIDTPEKRDSCIYPFHSFLYDNAQAIKTLLATGDPAAQKAARQIANGLLRTARSDGSYYNQRLSGRLFKGDGSARAPLAELRTLGDNAWFGLALLDVYRHTLNDKFLRAAQAISEWAEILRVDDAFGGYRGGFADETTMFPWRATEHNCDHFELNYQLRGILKQRGEASWVVYRGRADHAAAFVLHPQIFDTAAGHFWTGTTGEDPEQVNRASIPLDAQLFPYLTLGQSKRYRDALDWSIAIFWARSNLVATDPGPDPDMTGFTYSSGSTGDRVWLEGVAYGAAVADLRGETGEYDQALAVLTQAFADTRGISATSSNTLEDLAFGAVYDHRSAVTPTALAYRAKLHRNPFGPAVP